jgi:hypothetical protein
MYHVDLKSIFLLFILLSFISKLLLEDQNICQINNEIYHVKVKMTKINVDLRM